MATTASYPLPRERNVILASLLVLAAAGWAILIWQSALMDDEMGLTMGMGAPLFVAMWVAMMLAIMFPTAAPMILPLPGCTPASGGVASPSCPPGFSSPLIS